MDTDHTVRLKRLVSLLVLGVLTVMLPNGALGVVTPEEANVEPRFAREDGFRVAELGADPELSLSVSSGLGSESDHSVVRAQSSGDVIVAAHLDPEMRIRGEQTQPATLPGLAASVRAADGAPVACGASGGDDWITTSSTFTVVRQCTLAVPYDGWVFISADSSLGRLDGAYEAQFRIGIDGTAGDAALDRWVNVYDDAGDGTDKVVALSTLKPVTAGVHTFYLLGRRIYTDTVYTGTVVAYNPSLSVVSMPSAGSTMLACGSSGDVDWKTTSSSFEAIRQCTLTVPADGWVFLSASGSLGWEDGEYEAAFSVDIDNTSGDPDLERRVNVYDDVGDGTDESVALSALKPVAAGTHTFYMLGRALTDTGTVLVFDPTLTVIYVPPTATTPLSCGASGGADWETTSGSFEVIRQCTLTVPYDRWVYLSADGTLGNVDGEYEANFRIGVDSTGGDPDVDRWVNVYDDVGDGTDRSVALSMLKPVTAGTHTFFLLGRRQDGTSTVLVRDPTLTALLPVVPPQAGFVASPTNGVAPLTVTFTNTSSGDYDQSLWAFGDGATSTLTSPVHIYRVGGTYTVALTVSGVLVGATETRGGYVTVGYGIYLPLTLRRY
jgi:hypothetical protein